MPRCYKGESQNGILTQGTQRTQKKQQQVTSFLWTSPTTYRLSGETDVKEASRFVDVCLERGATLFDTAY